MPRKKKVQKKSVKRIINTSRRDLTNQSYAQLRTDYRKVRRLAKKRLNTYIKKGRAEEVDTYIKLINQPVNNKLGFINSIGMLSNFLLSNKSSYTKFIKREKKLMKAAEDTLGREFEDVNEYSEYKDFLYELYERDKAMWKQHYDDAIEMYNILKRRKLDLKLVLDNAEFLSDHVYDNASKKDLELATDLLIEAERLNISSNQFENNFKYWKNHVEDLKKLKPIRRSNNALSSYEAQGLKLPKIRKG